ncbi:MAG TPA: lipid II flippase MurJ, partial [Allosphingosinicella sp.]
ALTYRKSRSVTTPEETVPAPPGPKKGALVRSTLVVTVVRGIDFVLSFLVSVLLASRFGVSGQIDAFFLARRITVGFAETIRHLVNMVVVPAVVARQERGDQPGEHGLPRQFYLFLGFIALLTLVGTFAPGPLVAFFAPGFDGERFDLTSRLTSIMMPLLAIAIVSSLLMALLQANRRFFSAEASKTLQRALLVAMLFFLIPPLGIFDAAWTMLIGGVVGLVYLTAVSWRFLRADPSRLLTAKAKKPSADRARGGGLVAAIILQLYYVATSLVDFAVASTLDVGSVSALEYGTRLVSILPGLVTASVYTVIYPELIRAMHDRDPIRAAAKIGEYQRLTLFIQMPVSIGLMLTAYPIIDIIFGHGQFGQANVAVTAAVTVGYAAAAIFLMPFHIATSAIYADPARSPAVDIAIICVGGFAVRAALVAAAAPFGAEGIAWAATLATALTLALAMVVARRRFPHFSLAAQARDFASTGLCGLAAAAAGILLLQFLPSDVGVVDGLAVIALVGSAALAVYAAAGWLLRVPELREASALVAARFGRARKKGEGA